MDTARFGLTPFMDYTADELRALTASAPAAMWTAPNALIECPSVACDVPRLPRSFDWYENAHID